MICFAQECSISKVSTVLASGSLPKGSSLTETSISSHFLGLSDVPVSIYFLFLNRQSIDFFFEKNK